VRAGGARAGVTARGIRAGLPGGPPAGVAGPAGVVRPAGVVGPACARAARAGCDRRPRGAARPVPAVPATAGCGHGVYPGTVGIPGMLLGWLCSRPVLRLRKRSRGCGTMPKAAARCANW
jgi:hypothetical protein